MTSPSELSLECKPHHGYSLLLKPAGEQNDQLHRLEEFLARLEEERLKIDAFKRELPLCMQLLTNAVETSRQQLQNCHGNQGPRTVLEEFIPLKNPATDSEKSSASNVSDNKSTWMNTVQLWSRATEAKESEMGFGININNPKLGLDTKQRNSGAFIPFSKDKNPCPSTLSGLPDLALASGEQEGEDSKCLGVDNAHNGAHNNSDVTANGLSCGRRESFVKGGNGVAIIEQGKGGGEAGNETTAVTGVCGAPQTHRKARRCWSPDLHRRFVNALQILGGSQAATPKQIRELMKVDGLTNDEVKSHLQKYRLHTRRPSPSTQATGTPPPPQLVVLGGIWVPPEYAAAAHHGPPTLYSPHPAAHHPGSHFQVPAEFYHAPQGPAVVAPPPLPPRQLHLHHRHHHSHDISPEPDTGGGNGDRSESIEDGKSESGSWKADSNGGGGGGEHGAERKGGSGMLKKEENEESNGREITLKF